MATWRDGTILVSDQLNHRVQLYSEEGELLDSYCTKGSGVGELRHPGGLATDAEDNIYICDRDNHRIQVLRPGGDVLRVLDTDGGVLEGAPNHIAVSAGRVYVTDGSNSVKIFSSEGQLTGKLQAGDDDSLNGLAVDGNGYVFVITEEGYLTHFSNDGRNLGYIKQTHDKNSDHFTFKSPQSVTCCQQGMLAVCTWSDHKVHMLQI